MIMENRNLKEVKLYTRTKGVAEDTPENDTDHEVDNQVITNISEEATPADTIEADTDREDEVSDESTLASDLAWHRLISGTSALRTIDPIPGRKRSNRNIRQLPNSPGNRFVHHVPPPLRHIGCMWMDDGYEEKRCCEPAAWTMDANLNYSRLYCEKHALIILALRRMNYAKAKRRKDEREVSMA